MSIMPMSSSRVCWGISCGGSSVSVDVGNSGGDVVVGVYSSCSVGKVDEGGEEEVEGE